MHWEIVNSNEIKSSKELIGILLENRGLKTKSQKDEFINPPLPESYSIEKLGIEKTQLAKAIRRVKLAVKNNEQILVYGDYDADGITATAIMWECLHNLGAKAVPFIPNRFEDGYGINPSSVKVLKRKHPNMGLIITVDNGIVAFDAISAANKLGIDVIVTDHHSKKDILPEAHAIVHTTATSGSAVAWLFAHELGAEKNSLELAAIGTIADQLPLIGFNRSLVKYGLASLNNTNRLGFKKMFATSGLLGKKIGTYEVNFIIAPKINASGRMADGMNALRLLCTTSPPRADKLAAQLHSLNLDRQKAVDEAIKVAEENYDNQNSSLIMISHESFHEGVIGLIASRLVEKYYRPAIVFSVRDKIAKASARSINGFSIVEAIRANEELIIEGGGHDMAAGFSIDAKKISQFSAKINEYAKPLLLGEVLERKIKVDCCLPFSLVNNDCYHAIQSLEPNGIGNPAPIFCTKNVKVLSQKLVGKEGNHLKLTLMDGSGEIDAVMFNYGAMLEADEYDIAYRMNENTWNGKSKIELILKDVKEVI